MGLAAIAETLHQREFLRMKRGWVILAVLLLPISFVIYFCLRPARPMVLFRQMEPPAYSLDSNRIIWRIAIRNISNSKIEGSWWYANKGPDEKINYYGPCYLSPGQTIETGVITSKDSKDQYRLFLQFFAHTKLEEKISKKLSTIPILRDFVPEPKTHFAISERFRIPSPPTNGWPSYRPGTNH